MHVSADQAHPAPQLTALDHSERFYAVATAVETIEETRDTLTAELHVQPGTRT
jgi:hypothetical protein